MCASSCGALGLNATYSICESLTDYTNCDYSYVNTITYCSSSCVTGYLFVSNLNSHLCITSCPQGFGPSGTPLTCTACAHNWERDTATCVGASCPAGYGQNVSAAICEVQGDSTYCPNYYYLSGVLQCIATTCPAQTTYKFLANNDSHQCLTICPQGYGPVVNSICSLCTSGNGGAYWIRSSGTCAVSCGALGLN